MGAIIESIERMRMLTMTRSIALRLLFLYQSLCQFVDVFLRVVKEIGTSVNLTKTTVPSFTKEYVNFLIKTYNSIIKDLHSHFAKKDSYIKEFSPFEELDEPTIIEVANTLLMISTNIPQILSYMARWIETE